MGQPSLAPLFLRPPGPAGAGTMWNRFLSPSCVDRDHPRPSTRPDPKVSLARRWPKGSGPPVGQSGTTHARPVTAPTIHNFRVPVHSVTYPPGGGLLAVLWQVLPLARAADADSSMQQPGTLCYRLTVPLEATRSRQHELRSRPPTCCCPYFTSLTTILLTTMHMALRNPLSRTVFSAVSWLWAAA